jgi:hypothetical protein
MAALTVQRASKTKIRASGWESVEGVEDRPGKPLSPARLASPMLNAPLKWVGGKKKAREEIVRMIPPHTCYAEVFGGAGWILFAKEPSDVEVWNDIDGDLVNFYRVIKSKPEEFMATFDLDLEPVRKPISALATDLGLG